MKIDLIDQNGIPVYGVIDKPVNRVNYLEYPLKNAMDSVLPTWRRKLAFNQFEFVGAMDEQAIFGLAIVDLKVVSNLFFYLYTFEDKKLHEFSKTLPMGWGASIGVQPDASTAEFRMPGIDASISVSDDGIRRVLVHAANCQVNISLSPEPSFVPLRVCSAAGKHRWVFTQKAAGLSAAGSITWGDTVVEFKPGTSCGNYDWSAGYMRRETFWNWACLSGYTREGRKIGLNLATGVNESGVTENGIWIDDQFIKIDFAQFNYDKNDLTQPWTVSTSDGIIDLTFYPEGERKEKLDVWLLASNFRQMFGFYRGVIHLGNRSLELDKVPGLAEDHFARW